MFKKGVVKMFTNMLVKSQVVKFSMLLYLIRLADLTTQWLTRVLLWFALCLLTRASQLKISKTFTRKLVAHLELILTYHFIRKKHLPATTIMLSDL